MPSPLENLPEITGYMDEPDARSEPLLRAMGQLVWAAAALEKVLLLVIALLRVERDGAFPSAKELARLERAPAGVLFGELQKLDLPADLDQRIADAIDRRNRVIHRPIEDPEIVRAIVGGESIDPVTERVQQVALDCGKIAVELQAVVGPRLEKMLGKTQTELMAIVAEADLESIGDARSRQQVEAIRALGGADLTLPWQAEPASSSDD